MSYPEGSPGVDRIGHVLDATARDTLGITTRQRLLAAGLTDGEIRSSRTRGLIEPIHREVFRVTGTGMSLRRRLVAACLASTGTVAASHRAALWIWELGHIRPPVEISVVTARHPDLAGVVVHRSRDLVEDHLTCHRGVPVTTPARTLVDVGCVVGPRVFAAALESALHRRLVTVKALRGMIDDVQGRGRNGVGVLREALDTRALGDSRPESMLEPLMARLCANANIEGVEYQAELVLDGRRIRPDFLIRDAMLVIEVDGLSVHGTREALDHDLERQNLLATHGYQVLRYTVTHLRSPDRTADQILRTARKRRASLEI